MLNIPTLYLALVIFGLAWIIGVISLVLQVQLRASINDLETDGSDKGDNWRNVIKLDQKIPLKRLVERHAIANPDFQKRYDLVLDLQKVSKLLAVVFVALFALSWMI